MKRSSVLADLQRDVSGRSRLYSFYTARASIGISIFSVLFIVFITVLSVGVNIL